MRSFACFLFILFGWAVMPVIQANEESNFDAQNLSQDPELLMQFFGEFVEVGMAVETCGDSEQLDPDTADCVLKNSYPLAQKGNIMAAVVIGGIYLELGFNKEAKQWLSYVVQQERLPYDLRSQIQKELQLLP